MRDFEELLQACHQRGIRVMMDLVLNHTFDRASLVRGIAGEPRQPEARLVRVARWQGRGASPRTDGAPWSRAARGSTTSATDQYFYHAFLPFQPDLNWRNPEVREELLGVAAYWLDKGVDGFRLDLVNFLVEDESLRDNPRKFGLRPYDWQRHLYDRSQPESVEVARELRRVTDHYDDRAMMGEVYTDVPMKRSRSSATDRRPPPVFLRRFPGSAVERRGVPRVG